VDLTVEDIVDRCRAARAEQGPALAVRDVVQATCRTVRSSERCRVVMPPSRTGPSARSDDLTVLHVAWTPGMALNPHDHRMWAVIGLYGGQEDNAFFRRVPGGLEPSGGREVPAKEVLVLGDDAIHSVANTRRDFAVALHVYGGDFFAVDRSEWDAETYEERPRDLGRTMRLFEEANARWRAQA